MLETGKQYFQKHKISKKVLELLILLAVCLFYKCPFRLLFHVDCPGCGMTRAIVSAIKLDFKAAFQYHALFPIVILGGFYYVFREYLYMGKKKEKIAVISAAALFLIRWLLRMT